MVADSKIETRLFINNEFVKGENGKTFPLKSAVDGELFAEVYEASVSDTNQAVAAAKAAFPAWSALSAGERGAYFTKIASLIEAHSAEFAELECKFMGVPQSTYWHAYAGAQSFKQVAILGYTAQGTTSLNNKGLVSLTFRQPFGVAACIIPWNVPMLFVCMKLSAALAAGNTVVLKSSEKAPLTSLLFAKLVVEAGFPPGVVNILSGFGVPCGSTLASHMDIRIISFTGSGRTGRLIRVAAAQSNLKEVTLELGGKSPVVIFDDADLKKAAAQTVGSITFNSGQACIANSRIYVQESIAKQFIELFKQSIEQVKTGNPSEAGTDCGPLADEIQYASVLKYIEAGKKTGATLVLDGGATKINAKGYYVTPHVFTDMPEDAVMMKEEIFGPVVVINTFKTEKEGIAFANDTEYGLYAAVFTKDLSRAMRVSKALESGIVSVNCSSATFPADGAFGGYKSSGSGREGFTASLDHFLEVKTVVINIEEDTA